jgi:hypothetical protein
MLTKISLESESSRVASGSTQLNSESQRRARGSQSDGPLMLALNELKHIASGHDDTTLISAIQNLALVRRRMPCVSTFGFGSGLSTSRWCVVLAAAVTESCVGAARGAIIPPGAPTHKYDV